MGQTLSVNAESMDRLALDNSSLPATEERSLIDEYDEIFRPQLNLNITKLSTEKQEANMRLTDQRTESSERALLTKNQGSVSLVGMLEAIRMNSNKSKDLNRTTALFLESHRNSDYSLLSLLLVDDLKADVGQLVEQLMESKEPLKDSKLRMDLSEDENNFSHLREFLYTHQKRGWNDFAPLSYYFTDDKRFVIHVEGKAQNRSLRELEAMAKLYLKYNFPGYSCKIIAESFGATVCSSPEEGNKLAISGGLYVHYQLVGLHLESDSVIYWISTAHGLENVLASNSNQFLEVAQVDTVSCTRCLPPNVSLSIGGVAIITSVCKSFKYFRDFRDPETNLSRSVDIMLGPAPVFSSDVTGENGQERIPQMNVAGHLRPGGGSAIEYRITGVYGHSAVNAGGQSASHTLVYSTLVLGAPMTEGKVVTVLGDGGQVLVRNLPYDAYGSGFLAVEPSREGQNDRGHSGYVEPKIGHSGSVWFVIDNSDATPSCKAFAITVAVADNFCGVGRKVWLISDLKASLDDIAHSYPNHFSNGGRDFKCISRGTAIATGHTWQPETL